MLKKVKYLLLVLLPTAKRMGMRSPATESQAATTD